MREVTERQAQPVALSIGQAVAAIEVDTSLYSLDAIFRASYRFTDRCYIFLARAPEASQTIAVTIMAKEKAVDLQLLLGEICNELIDQQIRQSLSREMGPIRELIVAQAFAEGNLLDSQRDDGDYESDPLGIGNGR